MQTVTPEQIVSLGSQGIEICIPHTTPKEAYIEILTSLLQLSEEKPEAPWIIDLTDQHGISVALGGMLMNLLKMARGRGCMIKIIGIQNTTSVFSPVDTEWTSQFALNVVSQGGRYEMTLMPF